MSFGIDHPLIAVRDLDQAYARARMLGFTLNPRHSHPWGTDNHLLFFANNFIELIAIARPEQTSYADANGFRFARLIEARLTLGEGIAMVALESSQMAHDHALVEARGFSPWDPIEFRRLAHLPDGSDVEVGVALDILHDPERPFLTQFLCQQLRPELFRVDPNLERHPNQAARISAVWYSSDAPERDIEHFQAIHGTDAVESVEGGYRVRTEKGDCWLLGAAVLAARLPSLGPLAASPPRAVALSIECLDLEAAVQYWREREVPFARLSAGVVEIPPAVLGGTLLRFEQCEECLL
ncbi:VOC family protein [Halotalea alkalilenta]|uniref:VOC family protein n=1 Tax=Halotalea alkalilenta TaxID=376489 RepID=UPI000693D8D9|nr:VOC family protein [Halotalea alkalilenta]